MLGEQYQVDYIINLQDNASAGIRTFSKAASKLANATKNFKQFEERFNKMTATFNKQLELKISTSQASRKLNRVIKQLEKIHNLSTGINVGVAGSAGGGATNRRVGTTQVAAPAPRPTRASQPQGPRPLVAPKGRQPLVPRNLEYQVLGPTRLGNVAMLDMFKGMGLMYGISAIGSGVRDILSQSTEYENIMQTAMNILKTNYKGGNFNASFADMERIVREVGVETKFTAPEVADAVKFLAMAGLDINAISKSIRPIADIALIGDTDLGQTADVMTNIMTAYGIKPDDMRKTADVMTRTFTMSNTTLLELAESFKMAGSMLHLANVPFETAAAAFGVLGDAGIKATMAGTTMRTIMNNLRNPTKNQMSYWQSLGIKRFDEYGNLREINDIFADLNKLNSKDERAAIAKQKYEELQKEIAPKLEGLEEGSAEYNKVLADFDYEKKSEAIRKQFGGVDVFRLFRLTAASGAGVLMNSVEKWNKIIEENFLSDGLSQKLADEKKNTIAGMWAQLKSAFQEGGLKVFEENDGIIRGYLQKGISWLKSDQFTNILRSVIDLVADLGGTLLRFTKIIVDLYDKFGPLIKFFLKTQLYAKGFQTILVSLRQFGNSVLFYVLPLLKLLGGNGVNSGIFGGLFGKTTLVNEPLLNSSFWQTFVGNPTDEKYIAHKWRKDWRLAKKEFGAHFGEDGLLYDDNKELLALPFDFYDEKKYQRRMRQAKAMRWSGITSKAGGTGGYFLGNAINPEVGGMWGSLLGTGFGAIAPALLVSGPWGIAATAAVTAITGIVAAVKTYNRKINEADVSTRAWLKSLHDLNISKTNFTSPDAVLNKSMEIMSDHLLDMNQKLALQIELFREARRQKEGYADEVPTDYSKKMSEITGIEAARDTWDKFTGIGGEAAYKKAVKGIINDPLFNGQFKQIAGEAEGAYNYKGTRYWFGNRQYRQDFEAFTSAIDKGNPNYTDAKKALEKGGKLDIFNTVSTEEFDKTIQAFWNQDFSPRPDANKKAQDYKKWGDVTLKEALTVPQYANIIKERQQGLVDFYNPYRAVLESMENGTDAGLNPQKFIGQYITAFNVEEFGAFGTQDYYNNIIKKLYQGTDENKNPLYTSKLAFAEDLKEMYEETVALYNNLPEAVQPYFYKYLDKTAWEQVYKSFDLDLSNVTGGFYSSDQDSEQKQNGTPEQAIAAASDSLQAYKQPMIVPMWPEVPAQSAEQTEKKETPVPIIKMDMPYLFYKYPWENGASMIAETMRSEREQTLGAFTKNTENMSGTFQAYTAPVIQMYPEAQAVGRKDDTDGASVIGYGLYDRLSQLFNDKHQFVPFNMEEYGMVTAQLQTPYYNPYYNGENGIPQPVLPSTRAVNEALALAESGIKVQPNVTKNNTYTFTFQIENLRTDMDEDQLSQFIDERFIPSVIDKLDHSFEGSLSA